MILETDRLILRNFVMKDDKALLEIFADVKFFSLHTNLKYKILKFLFYEKILFFTPTRG